MGWHWDRDSYFHELSSCAQETQPPRGSALGSIVSTFGANHVDRGSNPTNRLLGR